MWPFKAGCRSSGRDRGQQAVPGSPHHYPRCQCPILCELRHEDPRERLQKTLLLMAVILPGEQRECGPVLNHLKFSATYYQTLFKITPRYIPRANPKAGELFQSSVGLIVLTLHFPRVTPKVINSTDFPEKKKKVKNEAGRKGEELLAYSTHSVNACWADEWMNGIVIRSLRRKSGHLHWILGSNRSSASV